METQQTEPVWGSQAPQPDQPKKRWSGKKTAIVVGVAVVIAVGGGIAVTKVVAGTTSSSANQGGPGGFGGGARMGGGPGGGLAGALHGDFTVSNNGSYSTERLQTGKVTAVSATSITAASDDGYTKTYVIDSSTVVDEGSDKIGSVKTGDTVTIIAKLSGDSGTATTLTDRALDQQGQQGGMPPGQGGTN